MNGVVVISGDACLYTETYIYHVVDTKLSEPARTLVRLPVPVSKLHFNTNFIVHGASRTLQCFLKLGPYSQWLCMRFPVLHLAFHYTTPAPGC